MTPSRRHATRKPDFEFETRAIKAGHGLIAGVDEAGRGPWAGPVVAAAVILDPDRIPHGLDDSKKLTPARREALFGELAKTAHIAIGLGDVRRIDRDNILNASLWAMGEAVRALGRAPDHVLVDGNRLPGLPCPGQAIIGGDARVLSIAAASIIAKVTRDRIMCELAARHPGYGWERNKGYGTREHRAGLEARGATPHHRTSFAPIRALLQASS